MSQRAPINLIPTEIAFQILSYLSQEDIKGFSSCSKSCRYSAIPFIFRRITILSDGASDEDGNEHPQYEQMVVSSKSGDSALYLARMDINHVSLICRDLKTVGQIVRYFKASLEVLGTLHNLQTLSIILKHRIEILNVIPDFHNRVLNGVFTYLSNHCPGYTSLVGLYINLTVGSSRLEASQEEKEHYFEGIELEESIHFLNLNIPSGRYGVEETPYPPSLHNFGIKYGACTRGLPGDFDGFMTGMICGLSLIQFSSATLDTVSFNVGPQLDRSSSGYTSDPLSELPRKITFPLIRTLTLNLRVLAPPMTRYHSVLKEFFYQFPNVENLNIAYGGLHSDENNNHKTYFKHLSAMPKIRKLRIFWPFPRIHQRPRSIAEGVNQLKSLTRSLLVDTGLSGLEDVTFLRSDIPPRVWKFNKRPKEAYKAIDCIVVRDLDGNVEVNVGREYRLVEWLFEHADQIIFIH